MTDLSLSPDETLVSRTRTHPKVLAGPIFMAVLCIAAAVAAGVYLPETVSMGWALPAAFGVIALAALTWVVVPVLRWRFAVYALTTDRIMVRTGILYRHSRDIPIHRIAEVSCERGILDRIFGAGTLVLADAASMEAGTRFKDVPNVKSMQQALNDLIYRHRTGP